jgi:hypothetical protein
VFAFVLELFGWNQPGVESLLRSLRSQLSVQYVSAVSLLPFVLAERVPMSTLLSYIYRSGDAEGITTCAICGKGSHTSSAGQQECDLCSVDSRDQIDTCATHILHTHTHIYTSSARLTITHSTNSLTSHLQRPHAKHYTHNTHANTHRSTAYLQAKESTDRKYNVSQMIESLDFTNAQTYTHIYTPTHAQSRSSTKPNTCV